MKSNDHIIGIHNVFPPVVMDSVAAPGDFWKVVQPPFMMFADIAVTPICRCDLARDALEMWEVV